MKNQIEFVDEYYKINLELLIIIRNYVSELKEHSKEYLEKYITEIDRKKHYKLLEYVVAYKFRLTLWENIPCEILEQKNALRYKRLAFPDYGIDLVSGDISEAYQIKWRAPKSSISFREVSTFFTYSTILEASVKRIITSENVSVNCNLEKLGIVKNTITNEEIVNVLVECVNYKEVVENKKEYSNPPLRYYQEQCLEVLNTRMLDDNKYIRILMACGTGKTIMMSEFILQRMGIKFLWLVPSIHLLESTYTVISRWNNKLKIGLVGSKHNIRNKDEEYDCVICTYNSVKKIVDKEFDVIIVDEGHHLDRYLKSVIIDCNEIDMKNCEYEITHTEDENNLEEQDQYINDQKDMYQEETSEETKGYLAIMNSIECKKIILMSATLISENIDYEYSLEKAIGDRMLTDYEICIPVFNNLNDCKRELSGLIKENDCWKKILAYCNTAEEAKEFKIILQNNGITAEYFDGTTSIENRLKIIKNFETKELRVLVTVYVLGEGVDIPIADTCMFVENRHSHINIVQCIGRVLRLHDSKTISHIIMPSINEEQTIKKFLRVIENYDYRICKSISGKKHGRINVINKDRDMTEYKYMEIYDKIGKIQSESNWMYKCEILKKYVKEHNSLPTNKTVYDGINIGWWMHAQKGAKKGKGRYKMDNTRIKLLEEIPGWKWGYNKDYIWTKNYNALKEYVIENNILPAKNIKYRGIKIGSWMRTQRYTINRKIDDEKVKLLEEILGWKWEDNKDDMWMKKYNLLYEYVTKNNFLPTQETEYKEVKIGEWISRQRCTKKGKRRGKMDQIRIKLLEKIPGWKWEYDKDDCWMEKYNMLKEYIEENKYLPSHKTKYKGINIGFWTTKQKVEKKSMDDVRIKLLEEIPEWKWEYNEDDIWLEKYHILKEYIEENKSIPSRMAEYKGMKIGYWVHHQRGAKKGRGRCKMDTTRIKLLEKLSEWKW